MRASEILSRAVPSKTPAQSSTPVYSQPVPHSDMRNPPVIPPRIPEYPRSGGIYRELMKKHDRFSSRHIPT